MTQSEMLDRIAELEAKVWDAHLRECSLNSKIRNKEWEYNTLLAYSRKQERDLKREQESKDGVEKLLSQVVESGRKMQAERDELQRQLEMSDALVSKAFDMATRETQRATELKNNK